MRRLVIIFVLVGLCMAYSVEKQAVPFAGYHMSQPHLGKPLPQGRGVIAPVGDTRSILGGAGKNICTVPDGQTIAVIYGPPSDPFDANNPHNGVNIAYSTDMGSGWSTYGPVSAVSPLRRIYPGLDGNPTFDLNPGECHFAWQEAQDDYAFSYIYTMIEENVPSSPSFSTPWQGTPASLFLWMPSIAINPDDPMNLVVTAWDYDVNGSGAGPDYGWVSTDGGYTWSDSMTVAPYLYANTWISAPHAQFGHNDYVFATYHDALGGVEMPMYIESTDGGFTWTPPDSLEPFSSVQQWWHEYDCEVCQVEAENFPVAVHNDIGATGTPVGTVFYPDPDAPGSETAWNWTRVNMNALGEGAFAYQGTTYTLTVIQYPSVSFLEKGEFGVILVAYKCGFEIAPAPAGWTDGNYLGGIVSIDAGRSWRPCRPMSGPLLQATGGATEVAHQLVEYGERGDIYAFSTWTDADDGVIGNQYFELGQVLPINLDDWVPGVGEYDDDVVAQGFGLSITPSIARGNNCCIAFNIVNPGNVTVNVYDATGRIVDKAFKGYLGVGDHNIDLSTSTLSSGVYIVSMDHNNMTETAKFISMH